MDKLGQFRGELLGMLCDSFVKTSAAHGYPIKNEADLRDSLEIAIRCKKAEAVAGASAPAPSVKVAALQQLRAITDGQAESIDADVARLGAVLGS